MSAPSEQAYCRLARGGIDGMGYSNLPPALLDAAYSLHQLSPEQVLSHNRALLESLLDDFDVADSPWQLSGSLAELYKAEISRIRGSLQGKESTYFDLENDAFRKDLAILLHRLVPFGAEHGTPFAGLSRSLMLRRWGRQCINYLRTRRALGARAPLLELHMHPAVLQDFNPDGWLKTYDNLADFLEANRSLLGVMSTSWFLDPALGTISPHLSYLREVPERCGAVFLFNAFDDSGESGALQTSKHRRALWKEGKYRPAVYTRVWPRAQLLERRWR